MKRRRFLKTFGLGTSALLVSGRARSAYVTDRKPNIIFILADDLGYGDLGCYGQKEIQTPHVDKMAEEGLRFTQHYAGSTVCAPSRCVLMTGLHTGHAYIRGRFDHMNIDQGTIAHNLAFRGRYESHSPHICG